MKRVVLLLALCVLYGCSEIIRPTPETVPVASEIDASFVAANAASERWHFEAVLTFVGTLEPGEVRVTPSGVLHGTDLVNEFEVTGDLEGIWYFIGKYHANTRNGKGRSIPFPGLLEVTSPASGTFECRGSAKIEGFPDALLQYGTLTGCQGTGDFEGMKMKSWVTNELNPGSTVYEFIGEIW